jgi:uncharacterized linocin/CFP29 family protein
MIGTQTGDVQVDSGRTFMQGSSGRWAGEQLMRALRNGGQISPAALRTLDLLRRDEWIFFDEQLVAEAQIRLRGVADLMAAGLTRTIPNGLAKTILQWETVTDMDPATVSLDGVTRSENDRVEFAAANLPLPITHKDFYLNLRTLLASRERGEAIDTTHIRAAGRKIAEESERMLFQGGKTFAGVTIYGYTTHPGRATVGFGTNGAWSATAKTGADIVADVATMISAMESSRMYGPYWLYVSANSSLKMAEDFKAASDKTIRTRLLEIENLQLIRVVDQLPADNVVLVQATPDVVQWVTGEPLQTVQWDVHGGFQINFKAFTIQVPLIRADAGGRMGIVHMA